MTKCLCCCTRPAKYQAVARQVTWTYLCQECLDQQYPVGNYDRGDYFPPDGIELPQKDPGAMKNDLPPEELCEGDPDLEDEYAAKEVVEARIETGPIQFGEDWPGVFLQGRHALFLANSLEHTLDAIKHLDPPPIDTIFPERVLRGFLSDLMSCSTACNSVKLQLKPIEQCRKPSD